MNSDIAADVSNHNLVKKMKLDGKTLMCNRYRQT